MNDEQRQELKWQFLTNSYAVRMQILGPTSSINRAVYNILSMSRIETVDDTFFDKVDYQFQWKKNSLKNENS